MNGEDIAMVAYAYQVGGCKKERKCSGRQWTMQYDENESA